MSGAAARSAEIVRASVELTFRRSTRFEASTGHAGEQRLAVVESGEGFFVGESDPLRTRCELGPSFGLRTTAQSCQLSARRVGEEPSFGSGLPATVGERIDPLHPADGGSQEVFFASAA